ncbi:MAG: tRNA (adenosine(37)-N6)-dimethylallyltransferase MiaA [Actinomycetota bacterium]
MTSTRTALEVIREVETAVPFALVGPTASGKTEASVELAKRLDAEILLIDSMTVYRGMNVGTAKPSMGERRGVPHHLVDVADPSEPFSVAAFQRLAGEAIVGIGERGRSALLVGGSGLYYRAVVDELEFPGTDPALRRSFEAQARVLGSPRLHRRLSDVDPAGALKIEPTNERRVVRALEVAAMTGRPFSSYAEAWSRYPEGRVRAAGIKVPVEILRARIEERARRQLAGGLLEETRRLLEGGAEPLLTASQAIGYAEAAEHLAGGITVEEAVEKIVRRTKALARRQMAWFRRDPRIRWFEAGSAAEVVDEIEEHLRG